MNRVKTAVVISAILILLGSGCASSDPKIVSVPQDTVKLQQTESSWQSIDKGIEQFILENETPTGIGELVLFRFDNKFDWKFAHSTSAQSVFDWSEAFPNADFVANAFYFNEDYMPSGLLITEGNRIGSRSFDRDKSGMLLLDNNAEIINTSKENLNFSNAVEAGQSFPFLILNGQPAVKEDSKKYASRTFVATDLKEVFYIGMYDGPISLFELSHLLPDIPVSWDSVLNLDGGPSSGYAIRKNKSIKGKNSLTAVPSVIIGTRN